MIRCVAIDDEPIALSIINEYCRKFDGLSLNSFSSPVEGMSFIEETRPDIVFMDIEMNSHNGLDLASDLPPDTCLIFTTAYAQYAIDGFNVDAIDFLHKPIFYPRFERAVNKAIKWLKATRGSESDNTMTAAEPGSLTVKSDHKNIRIYFPDITYIEAMDNYVKIHRQNAPTIVTQTTMKDMESTLPEKDFIRVHRSFIVSVKDVEDFSSRRLTLRPGSVSIPIGRKYITSFTTRMHSES